MLRDAVHATGIAPSTAASLLGINPELFQEWLAEQRPIPHSFVSLLSSVIGIDLQAVANKKIRAQDVADFTPAIWYRFRQPNLVDEDREYVFLIRQLGYYINELEEITDIKLVGWRVLFQEIRNNVDKQAPPRVQGRAAAAIFRENRGLRAGATGIGEVIRGNLRSMGVVVIETPIPESKLEGCCFLVGSSGTERPCVFANSHHSTWFRRNMIIMHEIAHAIFDAETDGAALDFRESEDSAIAEERADAFAQELMIPTRVLQHVAQAHRISWERLSAADVAKLVAEIHVGQKAVLRAALDAGFISAEQHQEYLSLDIAKSLRSLTPHALSAKEYIKQIGKDEVEWIGKRNTTIPSRRLRLPPLYVAKVVEAFQACQISASKAAEMLMIDDDTFMKRFGQYASEEPDF